MPDLPFLHCFSGNRLDRAENQREDRGFIKRQRQNSDSLILPFADDRPAIRINGRSNPGGAINWLPIADPEVAGQFSESVIFLGLDGDGRARFAGPVNPSRQDTPGDDDVKWIDLRSLAVQALLDGADLSLLAQARSLICWHRDHQFCARCGEKTNPSPGGTKRVCPQCSGEHFPRVDPVIIMMVRHGNDYLLGRQAQFAPQVYSALAGFVEPGESLAEAARREILEETGVKTGSFRYHSSQPWPFPSSLMIGGFCEARSKALRIDYTELEDARWFSLEELKHMLAGSHPDGFLAPAEISIACQLMKSLFAAG